MYPVPLPMLICLRCLDTRPLPAIPANTLPGSILPLDPRKSRILSFRSFRSFLLFHPTQSDIAPIASLRAHDRICVRPACRGHIYPLRHHAKEDFVAPYGSRTLRSMTSGPPKYAPYIGQQTSRVQVST